MAVKKCGRQTIFLQNKPSIIGGYSIVGPKEGQGPLGNNFDEVLQDELYEEDTWEKAESKMIKNAMDKLSQNANIPFSKIDYILTGDLLNQITASTYGVKDMQIPFFGLYGACSTMAESLSLGAMLIDGGFADYVIAGTSSHFCSAEKQFRMPLEYGSQRPPTAQWTVTGAGVSLIAANGTENDPKITCVTTGKPVDFGISDANNMGAAMAPAVIDTLVAHFREANKTPDNYDLIITGDLGEVGMDIVKDLIKEEGYNLDSNYTDCGVEMFNSKSQGTDSGGSGCGCSATVLNGYLLKKLKNKEINRLLFIATGALMSTLSIQQGGNIIGIAHAVAIENI